VSDVGTLALIKHYTLDDEHALRALDWLRDKQTPFASRDRLELVKQAVQETRPLVRRKLPDMPV
jgi:hypothetical protein